MSGRVHHLGQVVIDLALGITGLPDRGGDVFADSAMLTPGGGFNVIYAARRLDAEIIYHGALGDGPFAELARDALARLGVEAAGPTIPGADTGICVALTEEGGERTFVSTRGAETMEPEDAFTGIAPGPEDVVYISGYSFSHVANTRALARFSEAHADGDLRVLADVGPLVADFSDEQIEILRRLHPLWSVNEREAAILAARFGIAEGGTGEGTSGEEGTAGLTERLAERLGSDLVLRKGPEGAWFARGGGVVRIPTPSVEAIDTNGAGDAHSGVLCAAWASGVPLEEALLLANCAGALSTTRRGPATCPSRAEIDEAATRLRG